MSSNKAMASNSLVLPIVDFRYRQMMSVNQVPLQKSAEEEAPVQEQQTSEDQFSTRLAAERIAGAAEAELRMKQEFETKSRLAQERISGAITDFERSRKDYFAKVESEVVQLALAIAGKILHRESQVDPMLITALVQIALGQLKEGSSASIRVRPEEVLRWHEHFSSLSVKLSVSIEEDSNLLSGDCILQTELGVVNFSLDVQLKEVQQGFFDVLAQKPQV